MKFADLSSLWQRGTNEDTKGLIRQYFPKKTDFSKVSLEEIKFAQNQLNESLRKVLDWETFKRIFQKLTGVLSAFLWWFFLKEGYDARFLRE